MRKSKYLIIGFAFLVFFIFVAASCTDETINENINLSKNNKDTNEIVNINKVGNINQQNINIESIVLEAVGEYAGQGMATSIYTAGLFTHTVSLITIDPAAGKFFEGWLVTGSDFFSTGKLVKEGNSYVLEYTADEDQSHYTDVVITEETEVNGLDNIPETHIFEGSF